MYCDFENWLDSLLSEIGQPQGLAFNFNLYERYDSEYIDVQLIAAKKYDPQNDDWACDPCYSSGEKLFSFSACDWIDAMQTFRSLIEEYLKVGLYTGTLKSGQAITFGFVDGDLEVVWNNQ